MTATLLEASSEMPTQSSGPIDGEGLLALVTLQTLDASSDAFGKIQGSVVTSLSDRSPAAMAGLQPGDVITSVNRTDTTRSEMVVELAKAAKDLLLLGIFRDGHKSFLVVKR